MLNEIPGPNRVTFEPDPCLGAADMNVTQLYRHIKYNGGLSLGYTVYTHIMYRLSAAFCLIYTAKHTHMSHLAILENMYLTVDAV